MTEQMDGWKFGCTLSSISPFTNSSIKLQGDDDLFRLFSENMHILTQHQHLTQQGQNTIERGACRFHVQLFGFYTDQNICWLPLKLFLYDVYVQGRLQGWGSEKASHPILAPHLAPPQKSLAPHLQSQTQFVEGFQLSLLVKNSNEK